MQLHKISLWSLVVLVFAMNVAAGVGGIKENLSQALPRNLNKKVMNRLINNILNNTRPRPDDMKMLKALRVADRRAALKDALTSRCTVTPCLIRNPSIFPEDIAAICTRAYRGHDPIIQRHNKDYYFGMATAAELRPIKEHYRSLAYVIDGPDLRVPTYVTAPHDELTGSATKAVVDAYFSTR